MSRITNRKGEFENLPQLAGGELGWAQDQRRLFIGNGTLADGVPVIGNTELLTEFSNILELSSTYTFQGLAGGYLVDTGGDSEDITRSLISKLDDIPSVKDFGAMGDGVTDDTDAINRALYELFVKPQPFPKHSRLRGLLFPAGIYLVSGIIKIPPHAKLLGEGILSSILKYQKRNIQSFVGVTDEVSSGVYALSQVPENFHQNQVGPSGTVGADGGVYEVSVEVNGTPHGDYTLLGTTLTFNTSLPNIGQDIKVYTTAPECITTSDSNHLINLALTPGKEAQGIEVASMGFESEEENTVLRLNSVIDSNFESVSITGPLGALDLITAVHATSAIDIINDNAQITNNVVFSKMLTRGTTYALTINSEAKGVVLESSKLNTHYVGVRVADELGSTATGVLITSNLFDKIAREGIILGDSPLNSSSYNKFYDVGDNFATSPTTSIISINNAKCLSIGDLFERSDVDNISMPRIAIGPNGQGSIRFDDTHAIHLGSYQRQSGIESPMANNTTGDAFTLFSATPTAYKVDYVIKRGTLLSRIGTMYVTVSELNVEYNEEYTESAQTGVELSAVTNNTASDSKLSFIVDNNVDDATINYSIVRLD